MAEMPDDEYWTIVLHGLAVGLGSALTKAETAAIVTAESRLAALKADNEKLAAECEILKKALQREAR